MDPKNTEVTTPESPKVDPVAPAAGQSASTGAADVSKSTSPASAPENVNKTSPAEEKATGVPQKFVGKSLDDVLKSYGELEKEAGRLRNENGDIKRKLETPDSRPQREPEKKEPVVTAPVKTLEEIYADEWAVDPQQATINYNKRKEYQKNVEALSTSQWSFYNDAIAGKIEQYADFKEYLPVMEEITEKFAELLTPEARLSPQALQLAYLVAKGLGVKDKLTEATALTTQKATEIVRKREDAFVEGSSTATSDNVDFSKLSSEERRRLLGVADRSGD